MFETRFILAGSKVEGNRCVFDRLADLVVADVDPKRAYVLVLAGNSAERERVEQGKTAASTYTVEGVSVYVTADETRWSCGLCMFCGMAPCDWSRPQCRGEQDGMPDVTLTLPGELVQSIVGPQVMAAVIDVAREWAPRAFEHGVAYLSGSDANAQITTALDMLVRWRADAVAKFAEIEHEHQTISDVTDLLAEGVIA